MHSHRLAGKLQHVGLSVVAVCLVALGSALVAAYLELWMIAALLVLPFALALVIHSFQEWHDLPYVMLYSIPFLAVTPQWASPIMWTGCALGALYGLSRILRTSLKLGSTQAKTYAFWIGVYLLVSLLSTWFSIDLAASADRFAHQLIICAYGLVCVIMFRDDPDLEERLGKHASIVGLAVSGFLVWRYSHFFGSITAWGLDDRGLKLTLSVAENINLNVLTYLLALIVLPVMVYGLRVRSGQRWLAFASVVVCSVAIAYSASRTSQVFLVIEFMMFTIWQLARKLNSRWFRLANLLVLFFAAVVLLQMDDSALTGRRMLWEVAVEKGSERPFLGWGPGTLAEGIGRYANNDVLRNLSSDLSGQAHNIYVTHFAESGLAGALVLVFFFLWLALVFPRRESSTFEGVLATSVVAMGVRGLVETSGLFGAFNGVADFVSWFFLALLVTTTERKVTSASLYATKDSKIGPRVLLSPVSECSGSIGNRSDRGGSQGL